MFLELILAIIIVRYVRTTLQTAKRLPKWDKQLLIILAAAFGVMALDLVADVDSNITVWLTHAILVYLINLGLYQKDFQPLRSMVYSVLPYVAIVIFDSAIRLINRDFHNSWNNYIDTAEVFALIWMGAMWLTTRKQKKALDLERQKTQEREQKNQITETLKAALEVQVAERTAALTLQKEELQHALDELKSTQAQLIQSEKMASLGELTAGIAHEIQNPLNFVNNFSEINAELIEEMKAELAAGRSEDAMAIASDIAANEQKINHHGKRADAIVKGMLHHSRNSNGVKEPTDINALADEYLRLAYHGLRAKDKSFNATLQTDFNNQAGKINIIPQDIGRVILNLITNAFYAVSEKKRQLGDSFEPIVAVKTALEYVPGGGKTIISIKDNGNGVPQKVLDKIFQPFFTTKPTGQGTGLGLSLSYDIIKAHGGELNVKTEDGQYAEFIISLPLNPSL